MDVNGNHIVMEEKVWDDLCVWSGLKVGGGGQGGKNGRPFQSSFLAESMARLVFHKNHDD